MLLGSLMFDSKRLTLSKKHSAAFIPFVGDASTIGAHEND